MTACAPERMTEYATYVDLLFNYADYEILVNGNYDQNVNAFATGKTVFCHQGNWIDPNLAAFENCPPMGFIGEPYTDKQEITGLMVAAPSWYVVNSQSPTRLRPSSSSRTWLAPKLAMITWSTRPAWCPLSPTWPSSPPAT